MIVHIKRQSCGFTLLELIVVILVIAILAVTTISRLQSKQGFAESAWQKRVLSSLRNIQQRALQNTLPSICHQLLINSADSQFGIPTLSTSCSTTIDFSEQPNLNSGIDEMVQDGVTIAARDHGIGTISVVGFNGLGQPVAADGQTRICTDYCVVELTGEETQSVCVESEGFVHTGACGV